MADVYKTPGVYIKEIPTFPPSIAEVETAIPAFIGYTEKAIYNGKTLTQPVRITSLLDYETIFGGAKKETAIKITISDATAGGLVTREVNAEDIAADDASPYMMYYSLQMYFANGGGPCYISSAGLYDDANTVDAGDDTSGLTGGLKRIEAFDEPTLLVFPDALALDAADFYALMDAALTQCNLLQDRFLIMDVLPQEVDGQVKVTETLNSFRGTDGAPLGSSIDKLKYGAAYFPALHTVLSYRFDEADVSIKYFIDGTEKTSNADDTKKLKLSELINPPGALNTDIKTGLGLPNSQVYNQAKKALDKLNITVPAAPAVAGIYARVDSSRGVWKAPANESLSYVTAASVKISNEDQRDMNVDPTSGKSLNAIRYFTGKGVLVWGARTLAGNDNEWRYIPVRRFFNFAEESIKKGSEWVVFEPNDANTWVRVKAMIENFLLKQWRNGALAGAKPEDAFFVKVGLGVTMTALDILEGRLNIEIGMAVVRPAEFIILKFSHKLQQS